MFVFSKAKRDVAAATAELTADEMAASNGAGGWYATYMLVCEDRQVADAQGNPATIQECWYEMTDMAPW